MSAAAGLLRYLSAGLLRVICGAWRYHPACPGYGTRIRLFGAWLHERGSWIASLCFSRATLRVICFLGRPGYMSAAPSGLFGAWLHERGSWIASLSFSRDTLDSGLFASWAGLAT